MEEAPERGDAMTTGTRARALYVAELMRFRLGGHEGLLSASEDIVAALRSEGDLAGAADVLMMAGLAAVRAGDAARAAELLEQSHRLFESIGDEQGRAMTLVHLGVIPLNRCEYARAEEYFERGLALARRSGDPFSMFPALYHLALATQGRGQYDRACRYYGEFMTISEGIEDRPNVAYALVGLAECWGGGEIRSAPRGSWGPPTWCSRARGCRSTLTTRALPFMSVICPLPATNSKNGGGLRRRLRDGR